MTNAVYVVGQAGVGKSTFVEHVLADKLFGPVVDLLTARSSAKMHDTLRGHQVGHGVYLGIRKPDDIFPGTDRLSNTVHTVAVQWLENGCDGAPWVIAEGRTLSARKVMDAFALCTDLLLVHLVADPELCAWRIDERGYEMSERFISSSRTQAANVATRAAGLGVDVLTIDSSSAPEWVAGLQTVRNHLEGKR